MSATVSFKVPSPRGPQPVTVSYARVGSGEPLLLLRRRTWSRGMIATSARFLHPGPRFSLAGRMPVGR